MGRRVGIESFPETIPRRRKRIPSESELLKALARFLGHSDRCKARTVREVAGGSAHVGKHRDTASLDALTARERQTLSLICEGLDDGEMAQALHLSRHTVRNHVAAIYSKLHLHRRAELIIWAHQHGILTQDSPSRLHNYMQ